VVEGSGRGVVGQKEERGRSVRYVEAFLLRMQTTNQPPHPSQNPLPLPHSPKLPRLPLLPIRLPRPRAIGSRPLCIIIRLRYHDPAPDLLRAQRLPGSCVGPDAVELLWVVLGWVRGVGVHGVLVCGVWLVLVWVGLLVWGVWLLVLQRHVVVGDFVPLPAAMVWVVAIVG